MKSRHRIAGALTVALGIFGAAIAAHAGKFNEVLSIGDAAPTWPALPGVDGKNHSSKDYDASKVLVVAFISNRCPITNGYEERFKQFVTDYRDKGVTFVGLSVSQAPADNLEKMKVRAKEREFNFPYLFDPSQVTGRRFGATCTPHLFVLDQERKVRYMGAFDDSPQAADKVEEPYVRLAVDALLAGKPVDIRETRQRGCDIEYAE